MLSNRGAEDQFLDLSAVAGKFVDLTGAAFFRRADGMFVLIGPAPAVVIAEDRTGIPFFLRTFDDIIAGDHAEDPFHPADAYFLLIDRSPDASQPLYIISGIQALPSGRLVWDNETFPFVQPERLDGNIEDFCSFSDGMDGSIVFDRCHTYIYN